MPPDGDQNSRSCNGNGEEETLRNELEQLQESTRTALMKSWAEVESLQKEKADAHQKTEDLQQELARSKEREAKWQSLLAETQRQQRVQNRASLSAQSPKNSPQPPSKVMGRRGNNMLLQALKGGGSNPNMGAVSPKPTLGDDTRKSKSMRSMDFPPVSPLPPTGSGSLASHLPPPTSGPASIPPLPTSDSHSDQQPQQHGGGSHHSRQEDGGGTTTTSPKPHNQWNLLAPIRNLSRNNSFSSQNGADNANTNGQRNSSSSSNNLVTDGLVAEQQEALEQARQREDDLVEEIRQLQDEKADLMKEWTKKLECREQALRSMETTSSIQGEALQEAKEEVEATRREAMDREDHLMEQIEVLKRKNHEKKKLLKRQADELESYRMKVQDLLDELEAMRMDSRPQAHRDDNRQYRHDSHVVDDDHNRYSSCGSTRSIQSYSDEQLEDEYEYDHGDRSHSRAQPVYQSREESRSKHSRHYRRSNSQNEDILDHSGRQNRTKPPRSPHDDRSRTSSSASSGGRDAGNGRSSPRRTHRDDRMRRRR